MSMISNYLGGRWREVSQGKWRISITNKVKGEILRERELNDFWLTVSRLDSPALTLQTWHWPHCHPPGISK